MTNWDMDDDYRRYATLGGPGHYKTECSFCHQLSFREGDHPCCIQARDRGETACFGCEQFRKKNAKKNAKKPRP